MNSDVIGKGGVCRRLRQTAPYDEAGRYQRNVHKIGKSTCSELSPNERIGPGDRRVATYRMWLQRYYDTIWVKGSVVPDLILALRHPAPAGDTISREQAIGAVGDERIEPLPGSEGDIAYNEAVHDCIVALRALPSVAPDPIEAEYVEAAVAKAIDDYGAAQFLCGAWDEETAEQAYDSALAKSREARAALEAVVLSLLLPNARLRAALKRCHTLLQDAGHWIDMDAHAEWHAAMDQELLACDESGECPTVARTGHRSHPQPHRQVAGEIVSAARVTDEQALEIRAEGEMEEGDSWPDRLVKDLAADLLDARAEIASLRAKLERVKALRVDGFDQNAANCYVLRDNLDRALAGDTISREQARGKGEK